MGPTTFGLILSLDGLVVFILDSLSNRLTRPSRCGWHITIFNTDFSALAFDFLSEFVRHIDG